LLECGTESLMPPCQRMCTSPWTDPYPTFSCLPNGVRHRTRSFPLSLYRAVNPTLRVIFQNNSALGRTIQDSDRWNVCVPLTSRQYYKASQISPPQMAVANFQSRTYNARERRREKKKTLRPTTASRSIMSAMDSEEEADRFIHSELNLRQATVEYPKEECAKVWPVQHIKTARPRTLTCECETCRKNPRRRRLPPVYDADKDIVIVFDYLAEEMRA
jgi:hypothetical protein